MAWTPLSTNLGSVNENVSISHTVTYVDDATMTSYPVTITATETNPNTITISGDTLSGYYQDSFNNTITYRTPEGTFPVSTSRVFTYTATAKDGATTLATQTYTKTVTNDWTSGKTSLQTYVGYTL